MRIAREGYPLIFAALILTLLAFLAGWMTLGIVLGLLGIAIAGFLVYKKIRKQSLMLEMLQDMKQKPPLPDSIYKSMEWHMCLFLIVFAGFMAWVAIKETTATWLFWKSTK